MSNTSTAAHTNAIVASAFNLAAAGEPSIRRVHPSGMSPARAAGLPKSVRIGWVESYLRRLHDGSLKQHEPLLYNGRDAQAALDWLTSIAAACK